ncbi:MAG: DUF86 domain-containing protein [Nanoarchaeota archaeon]|nr:DUF86 domain-containing protein [Nanoarchaeota archaeon]MBU1622031.1 DUF86 domain-containing protein [Nanoarchaeota archaeon]
MRRNVRLYLNDILESASRIENSIKNISKSEFKLNEDIQDATIRRLEIIGEAVKNIPDNFKRKYSEIEWKKIAGMRDVLIHAYFGVNLERVWLVVKNELPKLKKQVEKIIEDLS